MNVQIHARRVEIPPADLETAERRFRFALGRFANQVDDVRVRLDDENGHRGGLDKRCLVEAFLRGGGKVVVELTDADVAPAMSRAADRIARAVTDELDRRRDTRRRPAG